ncbi:hypothetical protein ACLOJK_015291 [Asimina triloba]
MLALINGSASPSFYSLTTESNQPSAVKWNLSDFELGYALRGGTCTDAFFLELNGWVVVFQFLVTAVVVKGRVPQHGCKLDHGGKEPREGYHIMSSMCIKCLLFLTGFLLMERVQLPQGRKGINQDAMVVWEDFVSEDAVFCGVFDGHGPHGHLVARKVRDTLPLKLLSFLQSSASRGNAASGSCFKVTKGSSDSVASVRNSPPEDPLLYMWREAFLKSYKAMDKELRSHPSLDCFCSGSTAVTLVKQGFNLFIGNIGDSRAILGSRDSSGLLVAVQLTVDLKPDLPREAERIKRCKGRVFALQDEPEVQRVWLPFDDAPGLAMARAFGDFCLKDYGVISIPEFSHRLLSEKDQFVVLASDGRLA